MANSSHCCREIGLSLCLFSCFLFFVYLKTVKWKIRASFHHTVFYCNRRECNKLKTVPRFDKIPYKFAIKCALNYIFVILNPLLL